MVKEGSDHGYEVNTFIMIHFFFFCLMNEEMITKFMDALSWDILLAETNIDILKGK